MKWNQVIAAGEEGKFGPKWIMLAAIKIGDKIRYDTRHHLIIQELAKNRKLANEPKPDYSNQGFLLNNGEFISREEAKLLSISNGQLTKPSSSPRLYSEDLWEI